MKKLMLVAITAGLAFSVTAAKAASRTVTLAVSNMTCSVCPITVKKALDRVPGVDKTTVSLERKQATVTFDDSKTSVGALIKATTDAGYPSKLNTK